MIRKLFVVGVLCAASVACGASSSDPSDGNGSCPDLSGAWKVTDHCQSAFIGATLQVTENACALSFAAPFDQFHGSVTQEGKITLSGPQDCTGTATTTNVSMDCTPAPCPVKLAR